MPRHRMPTAKAEVSGAAAHDPQRFRNRTGHAGAAKIGQPFASMSPAERGTWEELVCDLPWLTRAHRQIVKLTCVLIARMDADPNPPVASAQVLSALLSKLGATPVDDSRVSAAAEPSAEEDEAERFFCPRASERYKARQQ